MRQMGMMVVLAGLLASGSVGIAGAAPGTDGEPGADRPANSRMEMRRDRMERLETRVLQKIKDLDAERYQKLMNLKEERPRTYMHLMKRSKGIAKTEQSDRGSMDRFLRSIDLVSEMGDLADGFSELPEAKQRKRRARMHHIASQMFDMRQEARRERVDAMEERLAQARKEIDDRESAKDEVVDDMVERVLNPRRNRGAKGRRGSKNPNRVK